jgi:uncharacterized protein (TIGR02328 family)
MRLWHQALIKKLPRAQLLSQHRECCALRGNGWGKKHSIVDYIFKYGFGKLVVYHIQVIQEMVMRGYKVEPKWLNSLYRGQSCEPLTELPECILGVDNPVYPEHNAEYLEECKLNLCAKLIAKLDKFHPSSIAYEKTLKDMKEVSNYESYKT